MKILLLMRHGKSDWNNDLPDFERPLSKRGLKDVPFMGNIISDCSFKPEIIFSSPAKRAKETSRLFASSIFYSNEIVYEESFYEGSMTAYLDKIPKIDDKYNSAIFIGHNPALENSSDLILFGKNFVESKFVLPTSAIIGFAFEIESWGDFKVSTGKVIFLLIPKLLSKLQKS